jgi:hypothetical protein|tara:strand:+ start:2018 stop:2131 length:114 start_codon:yes stop_codon:yes gene_type:complete
MEKGNCYSVEEIKDNGNIVFKEMVWGVEAKTIELRVV